MKTQTATILLKLISEQTQLRPEDLRRALKLTPAAIHRQLKKLVSLGKLVKLGKPPKVFYALAQSSLHLKAQKLPRYLLGLDTDLRQALLDQLRTLWAHTSTALEGNSLTLGETHQVLTEGLTISGKSLRDHNEVMGHARAAALMETLIENKRDIVFSDLFALHTAIQTTITTDVYEPIGSWKNQPNSTVVVLGKKSVINDTYAQPETVPSLMVTWLAKLNRLKRKKTKALEAYVWLHTSFVRIHPFADGNGRLARLLANIPILVSGESPLLIGKEQRLEYIHLLAKWQLSIGQPSQTKPLVIKNKAYLDFSRFCAKAWKTSQQLVKEIHALQKKRKINAIPN